MYLIRRSILCAILACISFSRLFAQDTLVKSPNRFKIVGLPLFFYSPDTKLGGGVGGIMTFNFPHDTLGARRSNVTIGLVYTQLKQVLVYFPFQLFLQNQRYWLSGEVGYYRYVYNFFGVGNGYPVDYLEKYDAEFPRLRLNVSRKVSRGLYVGLRYAFDDYRIIRKDPNGILAQNKVIGSEGGRVSGLGAGINYDTRDNLFSPSKGWLIDAGIYGENPGLGSDFRYQRVAIDASVYKKVGKATVLALDAIATFSFGGVPFHQMPNIGGPKRLRGYFEGKYRDNHLLILQGEFRQPLFWRIGVVGFGGMGMVAHDFNGLSLRNLRPNAGGGIRFTLDKAQKINLRADYGVGYRSSGFYLTFGEAF